MRFAFASRHLAPSIAIAMSGCGTEPLRLPPPRPPTAAAHAPPHVARELPAAPEPPVERHRYVAWTAGADAVGYVLVVANWLPRAQLEKQGSIAWAIPSVVGTPLVHAAHGNVTMFAISLPARAAAYGLAYAAMRAGSCDRAACLPIGGLVALVTGVTLTSTLDIYYSYTDEVIPKWRTLPVLPSVQPLPHGGVVSFAFQL